MSNEVREHADELLALQAPPQESAPDVSEAQPSEQATPPPAAPPSVEAQEQPRKR